MTKQEATSIISKASDRYGDKLVDFMNEYDLKNLQDATIEQLKEYIRTQIKKKGEKQWNL